MKTAKFSSALLIALLASPAFAQLAGLGGIGNSVGGRAGGGIGVGSIASPGAHAGFGTPVNIPRDIERPAAVDRVAKPDALKVDESLTRRVNAKSDATAKTVQDSVFTDTERAQLDAMRDVRLRDAEAAEANEGKARQIETGDSLLDRMAEAGAVKSTGDLQSADTKAGSKSAARHNHAAAGRGDALVHAPRVKGSSVLAGKHEGGGDVLSSVGSSGTAALKGAGSGSGRVATGDKQHAHKQAKAGKSHADASGHARSSQGATAGVGKLAASAAGNGKSSTKASGHHGSHSLVGGKAATKNTAQERSSGIKPAKTVVNAESANHADSSQKAGLQLADSRRPASAGQSSR